VTISDRIITWAQRREPDFVIGGSARPYLRRWWIVRTPLFCIYVHQFLRSDDDRALHDHPWLFNASRLLRGPYIEWVPSAGGNCQRPVCRFLKPGQWKFRWGPAPHRVQLHSAMGVAQPCWTLFITGPRVRQWGFYCPQGWMHWRRFTAADDPGAVGKGCDA